MKKSLFYSAMSALVLGLIIAPNGANAAKSVTTASKPAPLSAKAQATLKALKAALASPKPNAKLIQQLTTTLLKQAPQALSTVQGLMANAPANVVAAINAAIEATGTVTNTTQGTGNTTTTFIPPPVLPTIRETSPN